jgi:hypothetical protein
MNDKQIKAECCDFGREYLQWGGAQWWVLFNLQRGGGSWPATHCICGSKLTPPPEQITLTKEEEWAIKAGADFIDAMLGRCGLSAPNSASVLRSLLSRSRIKETE